MQLAKNMSVLLVEDDNNTRATVRAMLWEMGISQVFEARDGREAMTHLDAVDHVDIGLVICDWNMPYNTGLEVLMEVRGRYPDLSFLMITGRADTNSVIDARNAGVNGYIRKPFSMKELEQKILSILFRDE